MQDLTRRNVIAVSAAGILAAPLSSLAAAPGSDAAPQAGAGGSSKYSWLLAAPSGTDRKKFQQLILRDLAKAAAQRIPGVTRVAVVLQEVDAYTDSFVKIGNADRPVDAVLEITTSQRNAPVKDANAHLAATCGYVQGWHVHPTLIFDDSVVVPLGTRSDKTRILVFLQRLDGTTPEHFNSNWYKHAGHHDGQEADSEQSRAYGVTRRAARAGRRYIQNRVIEPLTPTQWVVNGYTDLISPLAPAGSGDRYKRNNGEEIFEEWPPRLVQGYEYVLV